MSGSATGCATLNLPAELVSENFVLVITAEDIAGNKGVVSSLKMNGPAGLSLLAGRDSKVLGSTALSTSFSSKQLGRDPTTGDIYTISDCQMHKITASTGIVTRVAGHPTICSFSGEGGALKDLRFQVTTTYNSMVFAENGDFYFPANTRGILKYTKATQTVSTFVGPVNTPTDTASETHRLKFASAPSNVQLGFGGRVYFSVATSLSQKIIYRVEDDHTVTKIAGMTAGSITLASDNAQALNISVGSFLVVPGADAASDTIYLTDGFYGTTTYVSGIYRLNGNGTVSLMRTMASPLDFMQYYPSLGKALIRSVAGAAQQTVYSFDPANPTAALSNLFTPGYASNVFSAIDDGSGNLFYTLFNGYVINYRTSSSTSVFAGIYPGSGDGGAADQADLGSPNRVSFDGSDNMYFTDGSTTFVRKIDPSGVIHGTDYNVNRANTLQHDNDGEVYLTFANAFGSQRGSIRDIHTNCVFICGNSSKPYFGELTSMPAGESLATLYGGLYGSTTKDIPLEYIVKDGTDTYIFVAERIYTGGAQERTTIKKITAGGVMSDVAGNAGAFGTSAQTALVDGNNLVGNHAGRQSSTYMYVRSGIIYMVDTSLYTANLADVTPKWKQQVTGTISGLVVDASGDMYYIKSKVLYKKVYQADGLGATTTIADFTGTLDSPTVRAIDPLNPNTLIITNTNRIYRYTNVTHIP